MLVTGAALVVVLVGFVGIVHLSLQVSSVNRGRFEPKVQESPAGPPIITLAEYEQLRDGMTYAQAIGVVGAPGREMSHSDRAGGMTVMYGWSNTNGSNANAVFHDNRLIIKGQFGLR